MYVFENFVQDQIQGLDYVFTNDKGGLLLVILPHGNKDGEMFDRTGNRVTEDFIFSIARILRKGLAEKRGFGAEDCRIVAAPCYPGMAKAHVTELEILGDWNSPTWAAEDAVGVQFLIKPYHETVRE